MSRISRGMAFILLFSCASLAGAQIILPASGRLAGPLNSQLSQVGGEVIDVPDFFGPPPPTNSVDVNGWLEIQFGVPEGDHVDFTLSFGGRGAPSLLPFPGGQIYPQLEAGVSPQPFTSGGRLDLITGEVESVQVNAFLPQSFFTEIARLNRISPQLPAFFPLPDLGLPLGPFPPGFLESTARFTFDPEGRIDGFEFQGRTTLPLGALAQANPALQIFSLQSFGAAGTLRGPHPTACLPTTPAENCPSEADEPDGLLFPQGFLFHPNLFLKTARLDEVPVERAAVPCAPSDRVGGAMASTGSRLYQIGGASSDGSVLDTVDIFDPETGAWQPGSPLPLAVVDAQAATLGTQIYVAGGRTQTGGPATAALQILDTVSGEWSQGPPLPRAVAAATMVTFGDRLFVLTGKSNRPNGSPAGNLRFNSSLFVYEISSQMWSVLPAVFAGEVVHAEGASSVIVGRRIYLLGGRTSSGQVTDRVLLFDIPGSVFEPGPKMSWGVYDAVAEKIGDQVFVLGGRRSPDGPSDAGVQLLAAGRTIPPAGSDSVWVAGHDLPLATSSSSAAVLNGELFVAGGRTRVGGSTRVAQAFDPSRGWQTCSSQPVFLVADVLSTAGLAAASATFSPGSLVTITGYHLSDQTAVAPADADVPTELAGVSLTIAGLPAPVLAVSPRRIDFQIPYEVTPGDGVRLELRKADSPQQAPAVEITIAEVSPAIFVQSCDVIDDAEYLDGAAALACHENGSLNYASNAVGQGEVVTIQMAGLGQVAPALGNGERAAAGNPPAAVELPSVTIRGDNGEDIEATVLSATLAAGEVGIYDVRVEVPAGSRVGNRVQVTATAGGVTSNRATISVGAAATGEALPCRRDTDLLFRSCLGPTLAGAL